MDRNTLYTGITGEMLILLTGAADTAALPAPEEVQTVGQLLIQLVIGAITIWKLVKKPRNPKP